MHAPDAEIVIVGGGIVGLATALALSDRRSGPSVAILEKENDVGRHQTGHNSGVIHAGIYYKPGSYKARLCVEGARLLGEFCDAHGIRYERCGKVIVATDATEVPRLQTLYDRGVANGVAGLAMISGAEVRRIEPHVRAVQALHSPQTGIVDFGVVARAFATVLRGRGVAICTGAPVTAVREAGNGVRIETPAGGVSARRVVNCAGLHADRIARLMGVRTELRIIPFRGEYYTLRAEQQVVRGLIYPVPDPTFPFLGVHFTRRIGGEVEAGPNAVLALAREGYSWTAVRPAEFLGTVAYRGFWAMGARYWRTGLYEMYRSWSKRAFLRALQRLVPDLHESDMGPGGAGVRAQAVAPDGSMVDDFRIVESPQAVHVLNAPSPAATASLAIGRHIASVVLGERVPEAGP